MSEEHSVRIEPHGRVLRVGAGTPILEAALAAGLNLPHSCKTGHCASCRARLLKGEVRYAGPRPLGVSAEEERQGYVLLCQARPRSDVTVEARFIASVAEVEIKTLPCRIARLLPLAPDVMQLWLRLPSVERLPFHAGQYLDVLLEGGRRRSFSIASPPHDSALLELHVRRVRIIAVVGLSADPTRPSHGVARALQRFGYRIIPVTPAAEAILGQSAVASLEQLPEVLAPTEQVDLVDVFRRPEHVAAIVQDCMRLQLPALWLQEGVVDEAAAARAQAAGIFTVMDRCLFKDRAALR